MQTDDYKSYVDKVTAVKAAAGGGTTTVDTGGALQTDNAKPKTGSSVFGNYKVKQPQTSSFGLNYSVSPT